MKPSRFASAVALSLCVFGTATAPAQISLSDSLRVLGMVTSAARPVEDALIIALNLSNFQTNQTFSNRQGEFQLPPLRAGVYRVIAVKRGFSPTIATVAPTRRDHQLEFRLREGKQLSPDERQQIWEIRRALPSDILRELDLMIAPGEITESAARFSGEMVSVAGFGADEVSPEFSQTAVGLRGLFNGGWSVDVAGKRQVIESERLATVRSPLAESEGVMMEVRSSVDDSYRIASVRNSWRSRLNESYVESAVVDFETHRFEWNHDDARVAVKYFAHQNLFEADDPGSEGFELAGEKMLHDGEDAAIGVQIRVGEEHLRSSGGMAALRVADLSTTGRVRAGGPLDLRYGVHTRVSGEGYEWAPETGAELRLSPNVAVSASALVKMFDESQAVGTRPVVMLLNENGGMLPRFRYTAGLTAGDPKVLQLTATTTFTEVDSLIRVVVGDRADQFWDGIDLEPGDQHRDVTVTLRRGGGRRIAVYVTSSAGRANASDDGAARPRDYYFGMLQSVYRPTRTSLDVSYRKIEHRLQERSSSQFESESLNFRLGQALPLPIDVTVLVGFDLARSENAPALLVRNMDDETEKRLVGGLSFAF